MIFMVAPGISCVETGMPFSSASSLALIELPRVLLAMRGRVSPLRGSHPWLVHCGPWSHWSSRLIYTAAM